jgi:hypothetical protein
MSASSISSPSDGVSTGGRARASTSAVLPYHGIEAHHDHERRSQDTKPSLGEQRAQLDVEFH